MEAYYRVGQRLSFEGNRCTVRFIGEVQYTKGGQWLGVEWDDPSRGKNAGDNGGIQYFDCLSDSPTAASFVRPSRPHDEPRSIVEAVKLKYAPNDAVADSSVSTRIVSSTDIIRISGKQVEEVGFDKVSKQLANLSELRILILDKMCIRNVNSPGEYASSAAGIGALCPSTTQLDLSRNLLEHWSDISLLFKELPLLASLRLDGNRLPRHTESDTKVVIVGALQILSIDDCKMDWDTVAVFSRWLGEISLTSLFARNNSLRGPCNLKLPSKLETLCLEGNHFTTLAELKVLENLKHLKELILKGNAISQVALHGDPVPIVSCSVRSVDLANNEIGDWGFIDKLPTIFSRLISLRVSGNPLFSHLKSADGTQLTAEDGFMLTLARVAPITTLNFSPVTPRERLNAETYYLSQIGKELSLAPEKDATKIISRHPRFQELCSRYGSPVINRRMAGAVDPNTLARRLVQCDFYLASNVPSHREADWTMELPKSFTIYMILGLVGSHFGLLPMLLRLVWETGEGAVEPLDEEAAQDDDHSDPVIDESHPTLAVEILEPRSRALGTWIDGTSAKIRVEWSPDDLQRYEALRNAYEK